MVVCVNNTTITIKTDTVMNGPINFSGSFIIRKMNNKPIGPVNNPIMKKRPVLLSFFRAIYFPANPEPISKSSKNDTLRVIISISFMLLSIIWYFLKFKHDKVF